MLEMRDRIDRKIREQLHPKDLFYQILDGLRSLTRYDHSSALLIRDDGGDAMEIAAEQIAWTKAKSQRIGQRLAVDATRSRTRSIRAASSASIGAASAGTSGAASRSRFLAEWLDFSDDDAPATTAGAVHALRAAGRTRRRVRRAESRGRRPGRLTPLRRRARRALPLAGRSWPSTSCSAPSRCEARMLTAERRHAMAELARGVSHDVNNALGSMLPLVQQMLGDLRDGATRPGRARWTTSSRFRSRCRCAGASSAACSSFARGGVRRAATGTCAPPSRRRWRSSGRHRAARHRSCRSTSADDDLPPVACGQSRSRAGAPQPADQRPRGDRHGGAVSDQRPTLGRAACVIVIADTGHGHRARAPAAGARAVLHDQGQTATASVSRSAGRSSGRRAAPSTSTAPPATARASTSRSRRRRGRRPLQAT